MTARYAQLLEIVDEIQPATLVEIGTWNGDRAIALIKQAMPHRSEGGVFYAGFDLFEDATAETDAAELNVKRHVAEAEVYRRIRLGIGEPGDVPVHIELIKGNTRDTLRWTVADLAFVDGGHSLGTIASDYAHVRESRCVVLDDFYLPDERGNLPDLNAWGCNKLVATLLDRPDRSVRILPQHDPIVQGGRVAMVRIDRTI